MQYQIIPELTTLAGNCLTLADWQQAGIKTVAFKLTQLLVKPGYDFLIKLSSFKQYFPWKANIILDLQGLAYGNEQVLVHSSYDGTVFHFSFNKVIALIHQLQPSIITYAQDNPLKNMIKEQKNAFIEFEMQEISLNFYSYEAEDLNYFQGDLKTIIPKIQGSGSYYIQTNQPAQDGLEGIGYTKTNSIALFNTFYREDYGVLDKDCQCSTCTLSLTRAYLHHLLQHTPLLAQRLVIQHNVHFAQHFLPFIG